MARIYKLFTRRRTVFYAIWFAMILAFPFSAQASSDSAFVVKGVKVDVTADSAAAAREQAFAQAQQEAFQLLAERLLSEPQLAFFQVPDVSVVSSLIRDFEVTEERLSSVRYVGIYTFRFKNDAVRNYFSIHGLAYSDVSSKPVLILPYYQSGSRTLLWGEDNPWLAAWNRLHSYQGLVPVIVPIGDLQDVSDMGDNDALSYSPQDLKAMTERYGAGETIIMLAAPEWANRSAARTGAPPDRLTIMVYRTDRGRPEFANKLEVTAEGGDIFEAAVRESRQAIQKNWKDQTLVNPLQGNRLKVRVQFSNMQEWIETQKVLRKIQGVNDMKLISLKPSEAQLELMFQGSEDRLRLALAQEDMTLTAPRVDFSRRQTASRYGDGYDDYGRREARSYSPLVYDLYLNKYQPYQEN